MKLAANDKIIMSVLIMIKIGFPVLKNGIQKFVYMHLN